MAVTRVVANHYGAGKKIILEMMTMYQLTVGAVRDQREVAALMGISQARVQVLERRAIRKLRIRLGRRGYGVAK